MSDYEHTATIRRPPDVVFDFLSAVDNLPSFFDSMKDAHATGGDGSSTETAR